MFLEQFNYGAGADGDNVDPDCVLLCQHADTNFDSFFERFPRIWDGIEADERTLRRYVNLEADRGSDVLAHATAQEIVRRRPDLRVEVIELRTLRALVDLNRVKIRDVLRGCVAWDRVDQDTISKITVGHEHALEATDQRVKRLAKRRGVFADIHSMAPHSQDEKLAETPDNLKRYMSTWRSFAGEKRAIDVITGFENGPELASPALVNRFMQLLEARGLEARKNHPYWMHEIIATVRYMRLAPGEVQSLAVDVEKGALMDHKDDVFEGPTDPAKVELLRDSLAESIIGSLDERELPLAA